MRTHNLDTQSGHISRLGFQRQILSKIEEDANSVIPPRRPPYRLWLQL
jgi:hypothetical protein